VTDVLVALGSNVGDRLDHLRAAVAELQAAVRIVGASGIYETAPMYVADQAPFYNAALRARTDLAPLALLALLKRIEVSVGRNVRPRNGPREIDLDLVGYGALAYRFSAGSMVRLQIPHPRTPERRFVLQPLSDVAPEFNLPGLGRVSDLLLQTEEQANTVQRIEDALFPI
jgi:2-amino-4-hydroxy-6-hydroxymethyldihydropteridine diphosphokinase